MSFLKAQANWQMKMTNIDRAEAEAAVFHAVAEAADLPVSAIAPNINLFTELGIESLGTILIYVLLNDAFGCPEPDSEEVYLVNDTPSKVVDYLLRVANT